MPVAEPFNALGRGNGFPFCPAVIDTQFMPENSKWITLGGFKDTDAGSPSQEQLDLSLVNAMKLFWNLYGFQGYGKAVNLNLNVTAELTEVNVDNSTWFTPVGEPISRICLTNGFTLDYNVDEFQADVGFTADISIRRLYRSGDFLGYIFGGRIAVRSQARGGCDSNVELDGWRAPINLEPLGFVQDLDYVEVSGIPFMCQAWSDFSTSFGTGTADAANLSATSEYTGEGTALASISSLDFYTYPA